MKSKENSKKTVLIAMDESIQSAVAAYLLKKQGLNCIAISFVFSSKFKDNCLDPLIIKDLKEVKKICKIIEITHYAIDAKDAFKDKVTDNMVAAKLSGQNFDPIPEINTIIFDLLLSKLEPLKADYISSGHFARVIFNQAKKNYSLGVANDIEHDESSRLSNLKNKHLEKMILPLSDIKYSGVEKIGKLIAHDFEDLYEKKNLRSKLLYSKKFCDYVKENSPQSLRDSGEILVYGEDGIVAEHEGCYNFHIGQNSISGKGEGLIDQKLEVISINSHRKTIHLSYPDDLKHTHCKLSDFFIMEGIDTSLPLKVYFKNAIDEKTGKQSGDLFLKNGMNALLIFNEEQKGLLVKGTRMVFYDKKSDGARVIGVGNVDTAGFLIDGRLRTLPETKQEKELLPGNKPAPLDLSFKF